MRGKKKMKVVMRSEDGERVYCEDARGKLRIYRTCRGKYEHFGRELEHGCVFADPTFANSGEDPRRHGDPLTETEKAYRKGFRACFAEIERMNRGKNKNKN